MGDRGQQRIAVAHVACVLIPTLIPSHLSPKNRECGQRAGQSLSEKLSSVSKKMARKGHAPLSHHASIRALFEGCMLCPCAVPIKPRNFLWPQGDRRGVSGVLRQAISQLGLVACVLSCQGYRLSGYMRMLSLIHI